MCALNCALSINLLLATNRLPLPPTQDDVEKIRKQLRIRYVCSVDCRASGNHVQSGQTNSLELEANFTSGNERIINV
jgi:hypothetical protein